MPIDLLPRLTAWKVRQERERQAAGSAWVDLDLAFTDATGNPVDRESVASSFASVLESAGVRKVRLYTLRHTMATLVLDATKDLKLVATRLGHANEYLVLRKYGHLLPGIDRQATDLLSEVIRRAGQAGQAGHGTRMAHDDVSTDAVDPR